MKVFRVLAFLLLASSQLSGLAWSFTATLRAEEYTDVLVVAFEQDSLPGYSVRRTGPQQITATFYQKQDDVMAAIPKLQGASVIADVLPVANGFKIILKTRAFGLVSMPVPGQTQLEIHVFSDPVGARWVDLSAGKLSLAGPVSAKGAAAKAQRKAPVLVPAPAPAAAAIPAPASGSGADGVAPGPIVTAASAAGAPAKPEEQAILPSRSAAAASPGEMVATTPNAEPLPRQTLVAPPGARVATGPDTATPTPAAAGTPDLTTATASADPQPRQAAVATPEAGGGAPATGSALRSETFERSLSLREALAMALQNNPRLSSQQARVESSELNINSARGAMLPHLQYNYGWNKIKNPNNSSESNQDYVNQATKTHTLQVQQNLFDGLVRFNSYSRAKLYNVRITEDKRKAELDTIDAVQREYYKLILVRSDIKTFRSSVARLKNQKDAAYAFYRLEMAPRLTVLQVETSLAQTEQRLSKALSDESVQLVKLNALLGETGSPKFDYLGDLAGHIYDTPLQFEDCVRKAQNQLPEIVIAQTDVRIAEEEVNIAEGKVLPRVDATASYIKQNTSYPATPSSNADRKYYTMGLNLSWELFSGGEQYYEIQSRKKLLKSTQDEFANLKLAVYAYVRESYLKVMEAKNQIRIAKLRQGEAAEAYEQASTRFRSGIGTNIDVLDAHEKVTAAESSLNQAHAEFLMSLASLHRAMGEKSELIAANN